MFVAMDALGILPMFITVTMDMDASRRRRVVLQALPTALMIGLIFFSAGRPLLDFLKIRVSDLQIAGGVLLFVYALTDMMLPGKPMVREEQSLGIVPLATPLIVGPAVLSLGLVLVDKFGLVMTLSAFIANLILLAILLLSVEKILRWIPINAMRAMGKVVDLLLAAIGVGFIREGFFTMLHPG